MKTAVYSTVYPQMLPYLGGFLDSVLSQSDPDFDLWLGLDDVKADVVTETTAIDANFLESAGETIAEFRGRVLTEICDQYDAVVLVDGDDVLLPDRVLNAKNALQDNDVYGCAMRLIDRDGADLNHRFDHHQSNNWEDDLCILNVIGFSNSAYRTELLKSCFPVPRDVVLLDWLTISIAVSMGATVNFDRTPQMLYRQYSQNTAAVISPFQPHQIEKGTQLVLDHYRFLLDSLESLAESAELNRDVRTHVVRRRQQVLRFQQAMQDLERLQKYTNQINGMQSVFRWWEMIAHPELENLWT